MGDAFAAGIARVYSIADHGARSRKHGVLAQSNRSSVTLADASGRRRLVRRNSSAADSQRRRLGAVATGGGSGASPTLLLLRFRNGSLPRGEPSDAASDLPRRNPPHLVACVGQASGLSAQTKV